MRFYLDEDLSDRDAVVAREPGRDAISSHECGHDGLSDEEQLRFAAPQGRCLVTRTRDHFIRLTIRFFENEWPHAGALIVPRSLPGHDSASMAVALRAYVDRLAGDLPSYAIDFLNRTVPT